MRGVPVSAVRPGLSQYQELVSGNFCISPPFVFRAVVCKDEAAHIHRTPCRRAFWGLGGSVLSQENPETLAASWPRVTAISKPQGADGSTLYLLTLKPAPSQPPDAHSHHLHPLF